jgi:hypothetical protein
MAHTPEKGTPEYLTYAQKKEKQWKTAELVLGIAIILGIPLIPVDWELEVPLAAIEGGVNWKRAHWSNVVKAEKAGQEHPQPDYEAFGHHFLGARRRHADIRAQVKNAA